MKLFPRSILQVLIVVFTLNFGLINKAYADDTLNTILDTLTSLTCETQGVGDLLRTEFSQTCIVAPFFTFAIMNLVSPVLYMNTFLKLRINDDDLFSKEFPGGQCIRQNRADSNNPQLTFGLCSNAKLALVRVRAVADSALAIAKSVLTGEDPWDDIKASWQNNRSDYHNIYTGKPGDSGFAFDLGFPVIAWKIVQDKDRICVSTPGFTGYVPVGCKYIKEPFPKSMYNNFMDTSDSDFSDDTNVQPNDPTALVSCSAAGGGCYQKAYNASKTAIVITSPLIECIRQMIARLLISQDVCSFDDVNQVINSASRQTSSLFQFQVGMYKIVTAFLTLYVIFFGFKILLAGEIPPKTEFINFILKMIFVTYFSIGLNITPGNDSPYDRMDGMIQWAFPFLLNGINGLAGWVMNASPSDLCKFNGSNVSYDNSISYIALWDALDCRVAHYLGLDILSTLMVENIYKSHNFANFDFFSFSAPPYVYLLIPAVISGNMMLISLALSYPLLVISVAAFMVNATVMCMISIVILGILAPLFVPMFLFTYTRNYFDSWVKLLISFLLQPMVVVTFMITMFSVFDYGFYGKCKYSNKLIHNSIENILQSGSTASRDVLIFYINNDWTQYTKEEADSCQNSLGYMLNNPISTAFNFAKDTVEQIVTSKPGQTCDPNASSSSTDDTSTTCNPKPGDVSTSSFISKFPMLGGITVGPGMFFSSAKLVFEKVKNVILALVTACFTLYLMYNFSSQLANFAADMTEGVSLNNVAIKPQAIFKAAMAGFAAAGAAAKGLDQIAARGRGGAGSDLAKTTGGNRAGDFAKGAGGKLTDQIKTTGGSESSSNAGGGGSSDNGSAAPPASSGSSVASETTTGSASRPQFDTSFSSRKTLETSINLPQTSDVSRLASATAQSQSSVTTQNDKVKQDTKAKESPKSFEVDKKVPLQEQKVARSTEENKLEDLSGRLNKDTISEPKIEEQKEQQVKSNIETKPGSDLSNNRKTAKGLTNDRIFSEQESHVLKQGEAGYVKQERENAEIRDRRAAFEKETEELYRSGGGRAREKDVQENGPKVSSYNDYKTERNNRVSNEKENFQSDDDKQVNITKIGPEGNLSSDFKAKDMAKGLTNDRIFNEQESHVLKQGEAGYVKQEMDNARIRDKKAAFEKETEELYRSGGGRAKDEAKKTDTKVERNDGTIENRSKKIDSGSDENS